MFYNERKKSILYYKFLRANILLLLIPIVVSITMYIYFLNIIEKEIEYSTKSILQQIKISIDNNIDSTFSTMDLISFNDKLVYILNPYFKGDINYELIEIRQELHQYMSINDFWIQDIFIYIPRLGKVVSNVDGVMDTDMLYRIKFSSFLTYNQWRNLIYSNHSPELLYFEGESNDSFTFIKSFPSNIATAHPNLTVFITIKEESFAKIINTHAYLDEGAIVMLSEDDKILYSTSKKIKISFDDFSNITNDLKFIKIDNVEYIIKINHSGRTGLSYGIILPKDVFYNSLTKSQINIIIITFLLIVFGAIVACYIANNRYNPILKLVDRIYGLIDVHKIENTGNEYLFIDDAITTAITNKLAAKNEIDSQKNILKEYNLRKLLVDSNYDEHLVWTNLTKFNIEFPHKLFLVMCIHIDDFINTSNIDDINSSRIILETISNKAISNNYIIYNIIIDNITFSIVNIPTSASYPLENIHNIINDIQVMANNNYNMSITATYSNIHDNISQLCIAYEEVLLALEYSDIIGDNTIIAYKDIENPTRYYNYNSQQQNRILNLLNSGNYIECSNLIKAIYDEHYNTEYISVHIIHCLNYNIVATIIKTLNDEIDAEILNKLQPVTSISLLKNQGDIINKILSIVKEVCEYKLKILESHKLHLLSKDIKEYIEENYYSPDLNIITIGLAFNLSSQYLSKLFKLQTNEKLHEYINKIRIQKATKLLLEDKHFTINNISHKIGYLNTNNFIRIFKKYERVTPGEYRKNYV